MMQGAVAREEVELSFKRYILEKTEAFAHEPMEDLYRVNLLGQMLDRYDELQKKGLSADAALQRTLADYADIPAQMRREGFEEAGARRTEARWPQLTEEEAADYVKQSNAYTHKIAMGSALCSACVAPMMLLVALMSIYNRQDVGGHARLRRHVRYDWHGHLLSGDGEKAEEPRPNPKRPIFPERGAAQEADEA